MFMISLDYVLRKLTDLIKENDFTLKMARSRWYTAETKNYEHYAGELVVILEIAPAHAKSRLHSKNQVTEGIGFSLNSREYLWLK